jgi:hypothetical protein
MAAEAESAETDTTDADDEQTFAWANQTPTTRLSGIPVGLIYADDLGEGVRQNDDSYGLVLRDPDVVNGSLWRNTEKPADATTAEGTADDEPRPTDYRVVDEDDDRTYNTTEVAGETFLTTGENGPSSYEQTGGFDEDEIVVWYNGMSGQRLARLLDFNGRPFAKWTDDGSYLVKGLYQPPTGWSDADGGERAEMAKSGKAPRVVRPPILRTRVEAETNDDGDVVGATLFDKPDETRFLINIGRVQGGRTYEMSIFDEAGFVEAFGDAGAEIPRTDAGYVANDIDSQLDMPYFAAADDVLEAAGYSMRMFTGDDFQNEPAGWEPQSTSEVDSFGIEADSGTDTDETPETEDGFTPKQQQFVDETVGELRGSGMTPDEAFNGGISGLLDRYEDHLDARPDEGDVLEAVYEEVAHLDAASLEA